jgi:hypothetical protein
MIDINDLKSKIKKGKFKSFDYRGQQSIFNGDIKKVSFNDNIMNIVYKRHNMEHDDDFDLSVIDDVIHEGSYITLIINTKYLRINADGIRPEILTLKDVKQYI